MHDSPTLTVYGLSKNIQLIRKMFKWGHDRGPVPKTAWIDVKDVEPLSKAECQGPASEDPASRVRTSYLLNPVAQRVDR